jgi:cysteine desulfurase / selenocysteine lyase
MVSYSDDFGPFDAHVWLNCAHQGPLPKVAVEGAQLALEQKAAPHRLPSAAFEEVPARLKSALGSLIGCGSNEVILGNSTSYGLNLLVQGLPLEDGDEVLLVDGDFPATVITWLPLRHKGVTVRLFRPREWPPSPQEIEGALTDRTRVLCSSWVFSFFGSAIDIEAIGSICRERGVTFVLNGSQAIGVREIDVSSVPIDALVSCGHKWLCGPYGTGFAWMRPEILASLRYEQAYWLAHGGLREPSYELQRDVGAAGLDVFGTANFLNFMTWTASVEYLLDKGIASIREHDETLVGQVIEGITDAGYRLISPAAGPQRSTLVLFTHENAGRNPSIAKTLGEEGIHVAERDEKLRIAPHLYNTPEEIERTTTLLAALA